MDPGFGFVSTSAMDREAKPALGCSQVVQQITLSSFTATFKCRTGNRAFQDLKSV